jgi:4-amino-4-deoxy-L-arabinose transferase-like glycosyltransferase
MTIAGVLTETGASGEKARLAAIALFAAVVAFSGVFTLPPLDRDESRFAQATAQMLETGDFIAIRFQDDERNKKPAGVHWLQAASVSIFSAADAREIWAYRIPSAIGAILAALFTYAAGRRLFGPETGLLAAFLIASAPAVAAEAAIAKTDALLLAATTGALAALVHIFAALEEKRRPGHAWPIAFWISVGAGVLLKGPIILMATGLCAGVFLLLMRRFRSQSALKPLLGAVILVLMIGPWALAIHGATEGRFFAEALGGDMLSKVGAAQELHAGPPGYYLLLAPLLFWPAAALAPAGLAAAMIERADWRFALLLSWLIPNWLVFELAATKLPHYTLPLYPALAILAACAAFGASAERPLLRRLGAVAYLIAGLLVAAVTGAAPILYGADSLQAPAIVAAVVIGASALLLARDFWRGRSMRAATGAITLSACVAFVLLAGILPRIDRLALSPRLDAAVIAEGLHAIDNGAPPTILSGYYEPSAIFLLGTRTVLADGAAAAERFMEAPRAVIVERREKEAFLSRLAALGGRVEAAAMIEGLNYSNGVAVTLTLYRPADAARRSEQR